MPGPLSYVNGLSQTTVSGPIHTKVSDTDQQNAAPTTTALPTDMQQPTPPWQDPTIGPAKAATAPTRVQRKRKQDHVGSPLPAASSSPQPPTGTPRPRLLHLFAGPPGRPDGLQAILQKVGWDCQECDILNQGDTYPQDLSDDHTWTQIFQDCQRGSYDAVWMGPECSTFSAARVNTPGPPPLRSKSHPYGLPEMVRDPKYKEQIRRANYFATQWAKLARTLHAEPSRGLTNSPNHDHTRQACSTYSNLSRSSNKREWSIGT